MTQLIVKYLFIILCLNNIYSQEETLNVQKIKKDIDLLDQKKDSLKAILEELELKDIRDQIKSKVLPAIKSNETLIEHKAMYLVYSEEHEQAKWVAHMISTNIIDGKVGRTNDFRVDTLIKTGTAEEKDYFLKKLKENTKDHNKKYHYDGFGYDRGHLAPSADFRWSKTALSESYFYSNMSPQIADFNRKGWANLEDMVRSYVYENNQAVFVFTGPVLKEDLPKIKRSINGLSIPQQFYKIVVDLENELAIGYLMPHEELIYPVEYYATSIDEIEKITSIDFLHQLDDELENKLESQLNIKDWLPEKRKNDFPPIAENELPKGCYNTIQARQFIDMGKKVEICGTVVSTHLSKNGHIFINLDKSFPKQIFSITIWESNSSNFSYLPHEYLMGKKICVKGIITENKGTPTMSIENEKAITLIKD